MLIEAVNELLIGDLEAGKAILRDYINATITFQGLAGKLKNPAKVFIVCLVLMEIRALKISLKLLKYYRCMNGFPFMLGQNF